MLMKACCCLQTPSNTFKFVGGEYFNESIPYGIRYADFMFKLSEKFKTAVSVKYHAPGEELVPDQLISVQDDADLQVGRNMIFRARSSKQCPWHLFAEAAMHWHPHVHMLAGRKMCWDERVDLMSPGCLCSCLSFTGSLPGSL